MNKAELFIYLLKSVILSGIFFGYYVLCLRNTIYHVYNRFYLLGTMALSVLIPFFKFSMFSVSKEQVAGANQAMHYLIQLPNVAVKEEGIAWEIAGLGIVSFLLLTYFIYSVLRILRLKANNKQTQMGEFTFIETDLDEAPFSFFTNLFWKKSISMEDESGRKILQHELAHIREKHTWDRMFSQFICALFWMNPFHWLIQKELQNIHEFIADREAVGLGEVDAFAKMLLQTYYGNHFLNPSHSFYYSSIKRRITMLTTSKIPKYAYLRKVAVLPMLAIMLAIFSIQLSAQKPKQKKSTQGAAATEFKVSIRPDSTTFSDSKTGKKVFSVATKDMPPPPPPAPAPGAPVPPAPPKTPVKLRIIKTGSETVFFEGKNKGDIISVKRIKNQSEHDQRQAKLDQERVKLDQRRAKLDQERAMLDQRKAELDQGRAMLDQRRASAKDNFVRLSNQNKPLLVIDGVITSEVDINTISPTDIQAINVLKGENALAKYPEKGANGVIEITTKKH